MSTQKGAIQNDKNQFQEQIQALSLRINQLKMDIQHKKYNLRVANRFQGQFGENISRLKQHPLSGYNVDVKEALKKDEAAFTYWTQGKEGVEEMKNLLLAAKQTLKQLEDKKTQLIFKQRFNRIQAKAMLLKQKAKNLHTQFMGQENAVAGGAKQALHESKGLLELLRSVLNEFMEIYAKGEWNMKGIKSNLKGLAELAAMASSELVIAKARVKNIEKEARKFQLALDEVLDFLKEIQQFFKMLVNEFKEITQDIFPSQVRAKLIETKPKFKQQDKQQDKPENKPEDDKFYIADLHAQYRKQAAKKVDRRTGPKIDDNDKKRRSYH